MTAPIHDTGIPKAVLAQYEAPNAPAEFATHVLARIASESEPHGVRIRAPRRWLWATLGVALAAAAVLLVTGIRRPASRAASGERVALARETVDLGGRAIAVLEPSTSVAWTIRTTGDAVIEHRSGAAFYRVDHGGSFQVKTPLGVVRVAGTCFRVEITDMNKQVLKSGVGGALLATAVVVTVYEGRVLFAGSTGSIAVNPGEVAIATPGEPPQVREHPPDRVPTIPPSVASHSAGTPAPALAIRPTAAAGMSNSDEWWDSLPHDMDWDHSQATAIVDRVTKRLGIALPLSQVECRTRCCRVTLEEDTFDAHATDLQSSAGLGFGMYESHGIASRPNGDHVMTVCWSRDGSPTAVPDRAVERDRMLASAADAIRACGHELAAPITLVLQLSIDTAGAISYVESNKLELGNPAADCAETAILQAAAFAPAPITTWIPVRVTIGAPQHSTAPPASSGH